MWRILGQRILLLIVLLHLLGTYVIPCCNAVDLNTDTGADDFDCNLKSLTDNGSGYVKAFTEKPVGAARGCVSQDWSGNSSLVVISLLNGYGGGSSNEEQKKMPRVTLNIASSVCKSDSQNGQQGILTIVLYSQSPIVWTVKTNDIEINYEYRLLTGRHSTVLKEKLSRVRNETVVFPQQYKDLTSWAGQKYGPVNGFIEVKRADVVVVRGLRFDSHSQSSCEVSSHFSSPHLYAATLQPLDVSGCQVTDVGVGNVQGGPSSNVYIIEGVAPPLPTALPGHPPVPSNCLSEFVVDVSVSSKSPSDDDRLLLVLKSSRKILWRLDSRNIKGFVNIITDDRVVHNLNRAGSVNIIAERLDDFTGTRLISWILESYSEGHVTGPVSYVKVGEAGLLKITVGEESIQSPSGIANRMRTLHDALERSKSIACLEEQMVVFLKKDLLADRTIKRTDVSLKDKICAAQDNGTHFVLHVPWNACGSTVRHASTGNGIIYENAVSLRVALGDDEGKLLKVAAVALDFSCTYGTVAEESMEEEQGTQDDVGQFYYLRVRAAESGGQGPPLEFPQDVNKSSQLLVEVTEKDSDYTRAETQFFFNSCWLDSLSDPSYYYWLIYNRCLIGEGVEWQDEQNGETFQFVPGGYNGSEFHLVCQIGFCDRNVEPRGNAIPLCQHKRVDDKCEAGLKPPTSPVHGGSLLRTGLFRMTDAPKPTRGSGIVPSLLIPSANGNSLPTTARWSSAREEGMHCKSSPRKVVGMEASVVIGVAFAAFVIGTLLTGSIWFIHTRTARRLQKHMPNTNGSADSTPSSTVPLAVHQVRRA